MKLASLLGAVAMALGVYNVAAAEQGAATDRWVEAFRSDAGETLYFDALNVKRDAGIVTYWERVVFKTPQKLSGGETYSEAVSENITECGSDWYAMKSLMLVNDHGEATRQNDLDGEHVQMQPNSLEAHTQSAVCKFLARVSALRPVVLESLGDAPQWTTMGALREGVTADVSRASFRKKGGVTAAVIRFSYAQPSTSPAEYPFRTMYTRFEIDCGRSRVREREADFTDDNGRLVDVRPASQGAEQFTEIPAGSNGVTLRRIVCGDAGAAQSVKPDVVATSGAGQPVADETWTLVARDPNKVEFSVDTSTIRAHGKYIESWQREFPPKLVRSKSGLTYRSVVSRMLDDCASGTSGMLGSIYYNEKGGIVSSTDYDEGKVKFDANSPQSVGQMMQSYVCGYARRVAGLKPYLDLNLFDHTDWIALGESEKYSKVELARVSVKREGSKATFVLRSQARTSSKSWNGMPFRFTFETWAIDCDLSASSVITADYYDESQRLVDVASVPNSAALTFTPIQVQSPLKKALKYVCAPQAADQDQQKDSGEPSLYTGTAWLGPKGYLITASHVVRGATAIVVGQDGHPVGEAEVLVDDPSNDVAILKPAFDKPGLHPLIDLAASPAKLGEHVFTLGYPAPDALGTSVKLTSGEISGLNGSDLIHARVDDARLLQISVPIQHGNSGGPILDERGQAVGVVVTGFPLDGEAAMQNVNYAIKIAYVRSLLADLPDIGGYRPLKPSASVTGLATDLRNSIFMLVVAKEKEK